MPCAPWHIVQLSASVAPRPIASAVAVACHRALEDDLGRHRARIADRVGCRAPARGNAGRAADARPEPLGAEVGLRRRQPEEADEHRDDGEGDQRDRRFRAPTGCARTSRRAPPSPAPDRNDRHGRFLQQRQLHDRIAVVHDRQADHHRHPQREAVQRERRPQRRDAPAAPNVNGAGSAGLRCARARMTTNSSAETTRSSPPKVDIVTVHACGSSAGWR